jgi:hypothetical protein
MPEVGKGTGVGMHREGARRWGWRAGCLAGCLAVAAAAALLQPFRVHIRDTHNVTVTGEHAQYSSAFWDF